MEFEKSDVLQLFVVAFPFISICSILCLETPTISPISVNVKSNLSLKILAVSKSILVSFVACFT